MFVASFVPDGWVGIDPFDAIDLDQTVLAATDGQSPVFGRSAPVLPKDPLLVGTSLYTQAAFVPPPGLPGEPYRLTNALELNFGLKF